MEAVLELLRETETLSPTCRRGEGFADQFDARGDTLTGQAVPFGVTVQLAPTLFERFEPGAFHRQLRDPARVKLCLEHGQVIGRCDTLTETEEGLRFTARISERDGIPEARRARDLLADDLVDELSIGFTTVDSGTEVEHRDDGSTMLTHRRARLLEISLVPWGVYGRDATLSRSLLVDHTALEARRAAAARRDADRARVAAFRAKVTAEARPQRPPVAPRHIVVPRP